MSETNQHPAAQLALAKAEHEATQILAKEAEKGGPFNFDAARTIANELLVASGEQDARAARRCLCTAARMQRAKERV